VKAQTYDVSLSGASVADRRSSARPFLRVGDLVEVRSKAEILATLDERGRLDELPFMPQMLHYCGQQFRVAKRVHKLCDTVHATGARRMRDAVLLEGLQCDGQTYGGCEMECKIFWKEAWLAPIGADGQPASNARQTGKSPGCREEVIWRNAMPPEKQSLSGPPVYSCQATQMPYATTPLSVWSPGQYIEDVRSGNARVRDVVMVLGFLIFNTLATSGLGFGSFLRWSYDTIQRRRKGSPYPCRRGMIPRNSKTPSLDLGLQAGELVKVKKLPLVLETVTEDLVNRGMGFHAEMVPYCDRTFRVEKRIGKLINEKTGTLLELKNQCLVLEGAPCQGKFSRPLLCPRGMSPYWREIWLERADDSDAAAGRKKDGE
jgi:hypothetical protein